MSEDTIAPDQCFNAGDYVVVDGVSYQCDQACKGFSLTSGKWVQREPEPYAGPFEDDSEC